jgi:surface antigen
LRDRFDSRAPIRHGNETATLFVEDRNMSRVKLSAVGALMAFAALPACSASQTPAPAVAAAPEPLPAGVVGVSVGRELDEKDRATAIAAQDDAVNSGQQKSWRGGKTAYGFIIPGPEKGECRDYTHKIYVNGRPQEAKGQACRKGDVWRVVS